MDDDLRALVLAAREAMVNAAKHSGVDEVSVFAEVEPDEVNVFVRDRGAGFDPDAVPDDRHGLADSVRGRMARHGGTVRLRSRPGRAPRCTCGCRRPRPPLEAKEESACTNEPSTPATPVRVFLVDDHALFRSGVRAELDRSVPDVTVVGEAGSVARRSPGSRTCARTSSCSTSTCPTAAAPRCCARSGPRSRTSGSWR